ncbi:MAG: glycosyltransferase family 1 protein [Patescibacteria group bacterium]|nr:glycosyltransferase family 1 protein [Patescibacteria group bacterium]
MRIAINAADLDHQRIDGTRIYIWNMLKNFGLLEKEGQFLIYHKSEFNSELTFPIFENYKIKSLKFPFWWTQTRFAWEMFREKPDVLWMPMHSLPFMRSEKTKTVVTIHDLAFKFFPHFFPKKDLRRLNYFTDYAVKNADKLIAVSNSTKNDILKLYPEIREEKIKVIYHGYDKDLFNENFSLDEIKKTNTKYQIPYTKYIIYVGAIQPRKNIGVLIDAFKFLRRVESYKDTGLVIAGDLGWLYDDTVSKIKKTKNVFATGKFETKDLPALLRGAEAFVLPSLYEGFGLPAIEAMACGTPVIAANNSSISEITGGAGLLFDAYKSEGLAGTLKKILESAKLRDDLRKKGLERVKDFSWEKCANETLEWLKDW